MHPAYQEHVLNAVDVCQNCLRIVREERCQRDPDRHRSDVTVREAAWSRRRDTTEVAYGPADSPSESKGVFCDCGAEGSFVRVWDDADVDRDRFREFVKRLVQSLEHKGVSVDRKTTVAHALAAYDDRSGPYRRYRNSGEIDTWLSEAVRYGLARAEASARAQPTA